MSHLGIDQHRQQRTENLRVKLGNILLRQVSTTWSNVRACFAELRQPAEPYRGLATLVEVCGFNELNMLRVATLLRASVAQPPTDSRWDG